MRMFETPAFVVLMLGALATAASAGAARAQSNRQVFSVQGSQVQVFTHVLTADISRSCTGAERSALDARAREISERRISANLTKLLEEAKSKGGDPRLKGQYLRAPIWRSPASATAPSPSDFPRADRSGKCISAAAT